MLSLLWLPSANIHATSEPSNESDTSDLFVGTWSFEDSFDNPFKDSEGNTFTETWRLRYSLRIETGGTFQYELVTEGEKSGINQTESLAGTWTATDNKITLVFPDDSSGFGIYDEGQQFLLIGEDQWIRVGGLISEEISTEADSREDEKVGQDETEGETQDNFILSDLNDQLGLFIANYGTGNIKLDQWQGWDSLNDIQKTNLEYFINQLDTILAVKSPLSDLQQAALNDVNHQAAFAEQTTNLVKDELDVRKNIRDTVWNETLRDKFGDTGVSIYKNYQTFKDVKGVYDAGANWINNMKDPDTAATEKIKKDSLSAVGANKTPQDLAKDAIGYINTIATASSVFHYAYYREIYDALVKPKDGSEPKSPGEAHQDAMDALRKRVKDFAEGEFGNINNRLEQKAWGPATGAALESGGIYDKAFPALVKNNIAPPKV